MLIFTDNAFVSIVAHDRDERLLEVRGQFAGDIEKVFPEAEVARSLDDDYPYVTSLQRDRVAEVLALKIRHIGYKDFNPGSDEPWRQAVYGDVASALRFASESRESATES